MASNGNGDRPMTWRQLAAMITVLGVLMAIFTTIHSKMVVPLVLAEAREQWRADIERAIKAHTTHPHPTAANKEDVQRIERTLERILERLK